MLFIYFFFFFFFCGGGGGGGVLICVRKNSVRHFMEIPTVGLCMTNQIFTGKK